MLQIIDLDIDRHFAKVSGNRFEDDIVDIGRVIAITVAIVPKAPGSLIAVMRIRAGNSSWRLS